MQTNQLNRIEIEDLQGEIESMAISPSGSLIAIKVKNTISIVDINWSIRETIEVPKGYLRFKIFESKNSFYLANQSSQGLEVSRILGSEFGKTIESRIIRKQERPLGNPLFDLVRLAFDKFGPHSSYIGCPSKSNMHFITRNSQLDLKKAADYFKQLSPAEIFLRTHVAPCQKNHLLYGKLRAEVFALHSRTRVPNHLATLESSNLVPLQDGENITNELVQNLLQNQIECQEKGVQANLIHQIVDMIKFGSYEGLIEGSSIEVVSIVGKQSGGKYSLC